MSELHQLIQDEDTNWYCVPVVYIDTFNAMIDGEWDEITELGNELLSQWEVDGPHSISFMWPLEEIVDQDEKKV